MIKVANTIIFKNSKDIKDLRHSLDCTIHEIGSCKEKGRFVEERNTNSPSVCELIATNYNIYFLTHAIDLKIDSTSTASSPGHRI